MLFMLHNILQMHVIRYSVGYGDVDSVLGVLQCVGSDVTVSLSTDYLSDDDHYIVHGKPVTLQCVFTSAEEITWHIHQNTLLVYSIGTQKTNIPDGYKSKVKGSHYSSDTHSIILDIDKTCVTCSSI